MTSQEELLYIGNTHKRNVYGDMVYSNNDIYNGNWLNDLRHGQGKLTLIYEGEWIDGKQEGTLTLANRTVYE